MHEPGYTRINTIVRLETNHGLGQAFMKGIEHALSIGADVVVNTDADNQYEASDIPKLVAPVVAGEADYVIGDRSVEELPHFSWIKKKVEVPVIATIIDIVFEVPILLLLNFIPPFLSSSVPEMLCTRDEIPGFP